MTLLRDRMFVAFDTETTGLSPRQANVVEIAGVRFTGGGNEIARFSTLANPGGPIDPFVTSIHGIDDAMVLHAPSSFEACRQFASWLRPDDILVAHNAAFDVGFITSELTQGEWPCPRNVVVDTLRCAKFMDLDVRNHKLGTLVEYFGFPETGYHRAMADSLYVKSLFVEFLREFPSMTLEEIRLRAGVDDHHTSVSAAMSLSPRFSRLPAAIAAGEILIVRYDENGQSGKARRILPLSLCSVGGVKHLVAQCMHDGGVKQFELDRIVALDSARA
ncbi:MAG: exonuclease domain-containing protein [Planctomycetota bacterium]